MVEINENDNLDSGGGERPRPMNDIRYPSQDSGGDAFRSENQPQSSGEGDGGKPKESAKDKVGEGVKTIKDTARAAEGIGRVLAGDEDPEAWMDAIMGTLALIGDVAKKEAETFKKLLSGCLIFVATIIFFIVLSFLPAPKKNQNCSGSGGGDTIVIDPGHPSELGTSSTQADYDRDKANWDAHKTGADEGASGGGLEERVVNQDVADKLQKELVKRGYNVVMTKTDSEQFLANRDRGITAKTANAKLIVKIHNDGLGPKMGNIFYTSNKSYIQAHWNDPGGFNEYYIRRKDATIQEDQKLATAMNDAFKADVTKNGIKYDNGSDYPTNTMEHPTNAAFGYTYDIPTTLIEMSSLNNSDDAKFIGNAANQEKIVQAYADGIAAYMPATSSGGGGSCGTVTATCGTFLPPNPASSAGYVQLPLPSSDYNINGGSPPEQQWGSPELVAMVTSISKAWLAKYPNSKVTVGDLSLKNGGHYGGHVSHAIGLDVDLSSHGNPSFIMTDPNYDKNVSIEFGKMLMDTKAIVYIFYNDTAVQSAVNAYASSKKLPGKMESWPGHDNHFHVRMEPLLYATACGVTESSAGKDGDIGLMGMGQFLKD